MEASAAAVAPAATSRRRLGGKLLDLGLNVYGGLALLYLLVPIGVILVFSFNKPRGRFNFIWQEFSLDAWTDPFGVPGISEALRDVARDRRALDGVRRRRSARSRRSRWCATSSAAARR